MIFPLESIPIIYNEDYGYIIKFDDLEYINEYYGLDYKSGIHCLLEENKIDNYVVAINYYTLLENLNILNEINNIIIISPSSYELTKKYIDFLFEQSWNVDDTYTFIYEGIIYDKYINEFIVNENVILQRIANGAKSEIQSWRNLPGNLYNDIKQNMQNYKNQYRDYRDRSANGNVPTMKNKVIAASKVVRDNIGDVIGAYSNITDFGPMETGDPALNLVKAGARTYQDNRLYFDAMINMKKDQLVNNTQYIKQNADERIRAVKLKIQELKNQLQHIKDNNSIQTIQTQIRSAEASLRNLLNMKNGH